jgi:hypothetical protein
MSAFMRTAVVLVFTVGGLGACSHQFDGSADASPGSAEASSVIGSGSNTNGIESVQQQYKAAHP